MQFSQAFTLASLQLFGFAALVSCSTPWNNLAARGPNNPEKALGLLIRDDLQLDPSLLARSLNVPLLARDIPTDNPIRRGLSSQHLIRRAIPPEEVEKAIKEAEGTITISRENIERYKDFFKDPSELPRHIRRQLPGLRASMERKARSSYSDRRDELHNVLRTRMIQEIRELSREGRRAEARRVQVVMVEMNEVVDEEQRKLRETLEELHRREGSGTEAGGTQTAATSGGGRGGRGGRRG